MLRKLAGIGLCAAALFGLAAQARADVVIDWNNVLLDAIRTDRTAPPKASLYMAAVHAAIYDAVNGILGGYTPFHVTASAPAGASAEAAAAAAAHKTLVALFPAQRTTIDAADHLFCRHSRRYGQDGRYLLGRISGGSDPRPARRRPFGGCGEL